MAFSTVPGVGPRRLRLLIEAFGSAKGAWEAREKDLSDIGLPKDVLPQLIAARNSLDIEKFVENMRKTGTTWMTVDDENFPTRLKNINDPPFVLFLKTNLSTHDFFGITHRCISVVGTRKMTAYGQEVTQKLVTELVANGFTIVSGMALGIDGVAHGTAINAGGKTIAVLGAGVDIIYPAAHRSLYFSIIERGGAIVSEVAPGKTVNKGIFPARNRIISGLSPAVLISEGAIDSGSLITARQALEQGREVLAVPGPINSEMAQGTNYLIKQGAKLVTGIDDILETLGVRPKVLETKNGADEKREIPRGANSFEQKVIEFLTKEPLEFDELTQKTGFSAGQLSGTLSALEIRGVISGSDMKFRVRM